MLVSEQAGEQAERQADAPLIIVSGHGWHPGVIGIVAGRLKESFGRPAIVIALDEDGVGKGSGRSITGVDLGAACSPPRTGPAGRRRRSCHGGRTDGRARRDRAAARFPRRAAGRTIEAARDGRSLLLDACVAPAGSRRACATRSTPAGPMAPAGPPRASPPGRRG